MHLTAKWYSDEQNPPPILKSLHETRRLLTTEGWCYRHAQAIMVAIDQYAEAATMQCDPLRKLHGIGTLA